MDDQTFFRIAHQMAQHRRQVRETQIRRHIRTEIERQRQAKLEAAAEAERRWQEKYGDWKGILGEPERAHEFGIDIVALYEEMGWNVPPHVARR